MHVKSFPTYPACSITLIASLEKPKSYMLCNNLSWCFVHLFYEPAGEPCKMSLRRASGKLAQMSLSLGLAYIEVGPMTSRNPGFKAYKLYLLGI